MRSFTILDWRHVTGAPRKWQRNCNSAAWLVRQVGGGFVAAQDKRGLVQTILASLAVVFAASIALAADNIHWTITGPTSISVDWRGTDTTVSYGTTSSYGQSVTAVSQAGLTCDPAAAPGNAGTGPYMEAKITGLAVDTVYHYKVGSSGADHTFRTPPAAGSSGFNVMVEGDIGDSLSYSNMPKVQSMIASDLPRFVLMIGDLTYKNDHGGSYDAQHFNDVMVWSQEAAYMPAWGNHEWDGPSFDDLRNYKGRFDFPNPQSTTPATPAVSDCGEDWYWFDYGNVRFIAFPEPMARTGSSSDSAAWTTWYNAMASASGPMATAQSNANIKFIVTFGHRPAYSSAHHTGETDLQGYMDALGCQYSKYVLNLNGHSHNYERTSPQKGSSCSNGAAPGVVHITAGTGGAGLEEDGSCLYLTCTQPSWSVARYMHQGVMKLSFSATGIDGKFVCGPSGGGTNDITCTQGAAIDSFTVGTAAADTTPPVISGVASSNITSTGAAISWTTNESADSQVEYGLTTSYGSTTTLDAASVTSHTESLTGLLPSTSYHYRVKSKDAAGNLTNSGDSTFATLATGTCTGLITNAATVYPVPTVGKPGYLAPYTDPTFGTKVTRIAGDAGTSTSPVSGTFGSDVRHHYNTDQPWSSDGALYAIQNSGSPSDLYLDGETMVPKLGRCSNYGANDDWWNPSPAHPHERIALNGNKLSWFDVTTCTQTRSWTLPISALGGVTEGSSWDGRYTALTDGTEGNSGHSVVIVEMDPAPGRVGPANDVFTNCGSACTSIDWVGVSPSGKYLLVSYSGDFERVFDINPDLSVTPHTISTPTFPGCASSPAGGFIHDLGHGSMAPNPFDNNEDVIAGQEHCGNVNSSVLDSQGKKLGTVLMVRMRDGQITSLTDPTDEADSRHISLLAMDQPGWAYVSYHDSWGGARFRGEIVAVKMDGSLSTKRLAHSHTDYSVYRSEAHAVPSRDGQRVAFASSWSLVCGTGCGSTSNPQDYIIDTRNMCSTDTTPPTVSSVASTSVTSVAATITWTTNELASSYVEYGLTTSYGSTANNTALLTAHAVPLAGLAPNTTYHYHVRSTDGAGNASAFSADKTFTTLAAALPVISAVASSAITATGATVTWTTDVASNSYVEYGPTTSYGSNTQNASLVTSHSVALTGLTPGTTYHYHVRSTDGSGNVSAFSADKTFTTLAAAVPIVSNVASGALTTTGATITWTTDVASNSYVEYGLTTSYGGNTQNASLVTSHSVALTGLASATTYHYHVRSTDGSGNASAFSADKTFTTLDGTPPPPPTGLVRTDKR
jgi:chitodextrinase